MIVPILQSLLLIKKLIVLPYLTTKSKEKHAEQTPCSKVVGKRSAEKGLSTLTDNVEPGEESATEKCEAEIREDRAQRLEEMLIFLCFALFRCLSFYVYFGFGCCVINHSA